MYKFAIFFITLVACVYPSYGASASPQLSTQNTERPSGKGTIVAVDIQGRTIQIDQTTYTLSDQLVVLGTAGSAVSQVLLTPGQRIEFWSQSLTMQPTMSKIHIVKGLNESSLPKQ